jgi:hypothetical protein
MVQKKCHHSYLDFLLYIYYLNLSNKNKTFFLTKLFYLNILILIINFLIFFFLKLYKEC